MIKAVFFDLYYTLVDYDPPREQTQEELCRQAGIDVTAEAIRRAMPAADRFFYEENARLPSAKRSPEEKFDLWAEYQTRLLRGVGVEVSREVALQLMMKFGAKLRQSESNLVLYDDVEPTLAQLKGRGLILGLITNVDYDIAPLMQSLGLASYLDFAVTSLEADVGKPDPAIFYAALKRAEIDPVEAVHVGDQYHIDVAGARNAGMGAILIDRGDFFPEVTDCPRIKSLEEVAECLQRNIT